MRLYSAAFLIVIGATAALAQNKQDDRNPLLFHRANPSAYPSFLSNGSNLLTAPHASVIPADVPTQFNEGMISAEEQFHDKEIDSLILRVSALEDHASFASGAIWAIGIIFVTGAALLGIFWKGIARVVVAEAYPRILNP
jgi:hypothetical protein